jgi:phosphoenolpyruvate synthase/pyruvate phosphate dikinase
MEGNYDPAKMTAENVSRKASLEKVKAVNENIARHIEIAQDYAYMRSYRIDVAHEADFYFRPCFNEIASRMGITYNDFIHLTVEEIMGWFDDSSLINSLKLKIAKRKEYFVTYLVDDSKIYIFEGKENQIDEGAKERPIDLTLTGKVAQKGKIIGKAKVVFNKEESKKVQDGDILVSPMTTPEMMVAIMKCAGIVTDEGGVASHAAQISREFGIPCIIGTGDASRLFRDNDTIELIADGVDGTVKLL